jgi:acetyl-CoA synthetase
MIISTGFRISPFEVESALVKHPAVVECAVTGVEDPKRGQAVKASIVLAPGYDPSPALAREIQDFVRKTTAAYKYPRIIEFVDELPKTISGKIRRAAIRTLDRIAGFKHVLSEAQAAAL